MILPRRLRLRTRAAPAHQRVKGQIGITERAVQRIIAELEAAGYLSHGREGRNNHYTVRTDLPLRHPIEQHCGVSALIEMTLKGNNAEGLAR